jgi:hypothetical protein
VNDVEVSGSTVYVGGGFTTVGGAGRNNIAALDSTGTATAWNPNANSSVRDVEVSGSTVYVAGSSFGRAANRVVAPPSALPREPPPRQIQQRCSTWSERLHRICGSFSVSEPRGIRHPRRRHGAATAWVPPQFR